VFTGIIETIGTVLTLKPEQGNLRITVGASFAKDLKVDQSVAHNGACLTVVVVNENSYEVIAIEETLLRTNLRGLKTGDKINLERSMIANGRLDGHIVLFRHMWIAKRFAQQ
jgi:riboflavin synthase